MVKQELHYAKFVKKVKVW